jgi:Ca-activated chloride channel family protein
MFRFENPDILYYLAIIPLMILLFWIDLQVRKKYRSRLIEAKLWRRIKKGYTERIRKWRFVTLSLAVLFLIVAWANPQWGNKKEKVTVKSADIFIALDISNSMLSEDVAPSRLGRAQRLMEKLIGQMKGDRIGIILFAGNAYLQMPLSNDYASAMMFTRSANTEMAGTQGTVIGDAIELAKLSFDQEDKNYKTMIIISDGEDHDEEAITKASEAAAEGLAIFTIGVGSDAGGLIPVNINGREDYKRDQTGQPVRTQLNEQLMKDIANAGDGSYFHINQGDAISNALQQKFDQIQRKEVEARTFSDYESYFQYFILIGLILIFVYWTLPFARKKQVN